MAYTSVPTGVDQTTVWNAAAWNLYLRDNFADHETRLVGKASVAAVTLRGDVAVTLTPADTPIQRFNTALTVIRAVTLPATVDSFNGMQYRIVRASNATGAFDLEIRRFDTTLIATLTAASQACQVTHDGTAWQVTDFVTVSGGGGGSGDATSINGHTITVSDTAPGSPADGDLWIDTRE